MNTDNTPRPFTAEELEVIQKHWKGNPPPECKGKCNWISEMFMSFCAGCGLDDFGGDARDIN